MFYPSTYQSTTANQSAASGIDVKSVQREYRRLSAYWTRDRAAREAVERNGGKPGQIVESEGNAFIEVLGSDGSVLESVQLPNW